MKLTEQLLKRLKAELHFEKKNKGNKGKRILTFRKKNQKGVHHFCRKCALPVAHSQHARDRHAGACGMVDFKCLREGDTIPETKNVYENFVDWLLNKAKTL